MPINPLPDNPRRYCPSEQKAAQNPGDMLVTLFTGQHLADFHERFGFSGPERLYGMSLTIEPIP